MPGLLEITPEQVRDICNQLLLEQSALKSFSVSLEQEFLDLGGLLRKISTLSREVQHQSDDVRLVAVGNPLGCPIDFAFKLLNKTEELARVHGEQYAHLAAAFDKLRAELIYLTRDRDALLGTLARLNRGNGQLRSAISYLDAAARAQFCALADTTADLITNLQLSVAQRFEELGHVLCTTWELGAKFGATAAERAKAAQETFTLDQTNLTALNDALLRSQGFASINLRGRLNIAGGVRVAMVALQCQDITRQKIEHINAGVDEMVKHLAAAGTRKLTAEEAADCRHYLGDAGRVQLGQLRATFEQLYEAARQVNGGLEQVASEMHSEANRSPQSSKDLLDHQVFCQGLASLPVAFTLLAEADADRQDVLRLSKTLTLTFGDCTAAMTPIARQLQAVALVTQTLATAVEGGGTVKQAIEEQCVLSSAAMKHLQDLAPRAQTLVQVVRDLEKRLQEAAAYATSASAEINAQANDARRKLTEIKGRLGEVVGAIRPLENELTTAVEQARARIHFPQAVAEVSAHATALFEKIGKEWGLAQGAGERMQPHQKVNELKRHYTMVDEHSIHDKSVGTAPSITEDDASSSVVFFDDEPEPASSKEAAREEEPLADNVELF